MASSTIEMERMYRRVREMRSMIYKGPQGGEKEEILILTLIGGWEANFLQWGLKCLCL